MRIGMSAAAASVLLNCWAAVPAGADAAAIGVSWIRADGIVERDLVVSGIDLKTAAPLPVPTIDIAPSPEAGRLLLAQGRTTGNVDLRATGNPSVAPLKWVGLVMNRVDKKNYNYCTGQFIAPRIVLTAGHCVKEEGKNTWKDINNMTFILQFQNGEGSRVYKAVCAATLEAYRFPADYADLPEVEQNAAFLKAAQHDYAMILVDSDSLTGVIRWQADWKGKWVGATRVGYPGQILGGEIVQQSHGIVFFADAIPIFTKGGNPVAYPGLVVHWQSVINLTQGSSGGAWVANSASNEGQNSNVAISVTSFNNNAFPGAMFGPYFTEKGFNALLRYTAAGCKGE